MMSIEAQPIDLSPPSAQTIREMAQIILATCHLEAYIEHFCASPNGQAILANLCNACAKACAKENDDEYSDEFYSYKPELIKSAIAGYCAASKDAFWSESGIIYLESAFGQVSFHDVSDFWHSLPVANGREWDKQHRQEVAVELAIAYLLGWQYEKHEHVLSLLASKCNEATEPVEWLFPGMCFSLLIDVKSDTTLLSWQF